MTTPARGPEIAGLTFLQVLGSGGYSEVYLYERTSPRMRVAVKVLNAARLSPAERTQFADEAETMAQLSDHPYIVQVFSTGVTYDERPYLVMKYFPPPNLAERATRERFSVPDVLRTGVKIASAVETAHRAGILHRDIKPANILISSYGEPGLTDFGIAGHAADFTPVGNEISVSIPWAPPEVLSGQSNGSPQSDVYSLAATVWHLLAGRSPFEVPNGENTAAALTVRALHSPPPRTGRADVPDSLERLLAQAMSKNPAVRPRTALEFARELQAIEQEHRFGRTEIVVQSLGHAPAAGASPDGPAHQLGGYPAMAPATVARPLRAPETVARPLRAPAAPARQEGGGPPERGTHKGWIGVGAAAAVVAAVVVGIVLSSGGSGGGGSPTPEPTGTHVQQLAQPPGQPVVTARYDRARKVVAFTWTYTGHESGDYFEVATSLSAPKKSLDVARYEVRTTHPAKTCLVVAAYRGTSQIGSEYSKQSCG